MSDWCGNRLAGRAARRSTRSSSAPSSPSSRRAARRSSRAPRPGQRAARRRRSGPWSTRPSCSRRRQLGITVCSLLILNVSEPAIHHLLEGPLQPHRLARGGHRHGRVHHHAGGRVVPARGVRRDGAEEHLVLAARPRRAAARAAAGRRSRRVFRPVIVALNAIANGVLRLFGVEPKDEATSAFTRRRGRDDRGQSHARGRAHRLAPARSARRSSSPTKTVARRRGRRCRSWSPCPRTRPRPTSSAPSPSTASRATCSSTTAGEPTGYLHLKDVIDLEDDEASTSPVPAEAHPPAGLDLRGTPTSRTRSRRCAAPARHVARSFDAEGDDHAACCSSRTSSRSWSARCRTRPGATSPQRIRRVGADARSASSATASARRSPARARSSGTSGSARCRRGRRRSPRWARSRRSG